MKLKYPEHQLVFVMDNCTSHKTSLTMKVMQEERCHLLFTASNSPEFSPVENLFQLLKRRMIDKPFVTKE